MKNLLLILLFTILLLSIFKINASIDTFPLLGITIIIDPGHGGVDSGTINNNILEKEINLSISKHLDSSLSKEGAVVYLTREEDISLSNKNAIYHKKSDLDNRIKIINSYPQSIYLSIHQNHYENSIYYGPQVFYTNNNKNNITLAKIIQEELNNNLGGNRKIKEITNIYMYQRINTLGVLIECGFLSNKNDQKNLINPEYQKKISEIITNAIIQYINQNKKV